MSFWLILSKGAIEAIEGLSGVRLNEPILATMKASNILFENAKSMPSFHSLHATVCWASPGKSGKFIIKQQQPAPVNFRLRAAGRLSGKQACFSRPVAQPTEHRLPLSLKNTLKSISTVYSLTKLLSQKKSGRFMQMQKLVIHGTILQYSQYGPRWFDRRKP